MYHYIVVRRDLPLGFLAAQVVHAAGETSPGNLPPDTNAIVLSVPDEPALLRLAADLCTQQVAHHLVREPDPPWLGQATAIGIPPGPRALTRPYLRALPLLGKEVPPP